MLRLWLVPAVCDMPWLDSGRSSDSNEGFGEGGADMVVQWEGIAIGWIRTGPSGVFLAD